MRRRRRENGNLCSMSTVVKKPPRSSTRHFFWNGRKVLSDESNETSNGSQPTIWWVRSRGVGLVGASMLTLNSSTQKHKQKLWRKLWWRRKAFSKKEENFSNFPQLIESPENKFNSTANDNKKSEVFEFSYGSKVRIKVCLGVANKQIIGNRIRTCDKVARWLEHCRLARKRIKFSCLLLHLERTSSETQTQPFKRPIILSRNETNLNYLDGLTFILKL